MDDAGLSRDLYAFVHPAGAIGIVPANLKDALIAGVRKWRVATASAEAILVADEIVAFGDTLTPDAQGRLLFSPHLCRWGDVAQGARAPVTWLGRGCWAELWRTGRRESQFLEGRFAGPVGCRWEDRDLTRVIATFAQMMDRLEELA